MKHVVDGWWRRRGASLLALVILAGLAVWAPVPLAWQLSFRLALVLVPYIAVAPRLWTIARQSCEHDEGAYAARDSEPLRLATMARPSVTRTVPMTVVQRTYLATLAAAHQHEEESHG